MQLFPNKPYRNRLRKIVAFDASSDTVLYIDVDVVILNSLSPLFTKFDRSEYTVAFSTHSSDNVYVGAWKSDENLKDFNLFASGFLFVKGGTLGSGLIVKTLNEHLDNYLEHRHPNVIDQPILNYVVDRLKIRAARIDLIDKTASPHSWYNDTAIEYKDGHAFTHGARVVHFVHWAGTNKTETSSTDLARVRNVTALQACRTLARAGMNFEAYSLPAYSFEFQGKKVGAGSYGDDYLPRLAEAIFRHIADLRCRRFLEWGTGLTTLLLWDILNAYGGGELITLDNYRPYSDAVKKGAGAPIGLDFQVIDLNGPCQSQADKGLNYSTQPLSLAGDFDLIFIDGRRRMECLLSSLFSHP